MANLFFSMDISGDFQTDSGLDPLLEAELRAPSFPDRVLPDATYSGEDLSSREVSIIPAENGTSNNRTNKLLLKIVAAPIRSDSHPALDLDTDNLDTTLSSFTDILEKEVSVISPQQLPSIAQDPTSSSLEFYLDSPEGRATLGDMQFLEPPEENPAYDFLSTASSTSHTMSTISCSANNHLNNTCLPTQRTEPLHKSTKNTFDWPGDAFFEVNFSGSKTTTSEPLVLNSPFPNDQPQPPLSEQQIIFIKALTITTAISTNRFKTFLVKNNYTGHCANRPLLIVKRDVLKRLEKLTEAEKNQLEKDHNISKSDINMLLNSHQNALKTTKKRSRSTFSVYSFHENDFIFLRALLKDPSLDGLQKNLENTKYSGSLLQDKLIMTKSRLLGALRGVDCGAKILLSRQGINKFQIDQLLSRFNSSDIILLKALLANYNQKDFLIAVSKSLEETEYSGSKGYNDLQRKQLTLLKWVKYPTLYDKAYLSSEGITQDQIDQLLSLTDQRFTVSEIILLKALILEHDPNGSQKNLDEILTTLNYTANRLPENLSRKKNFLLIKLSKLSTHDKEYLSSEGITESNIQQLLTS